ncbi:MAG TPA: hypothetical protein DCY84_06130 [Firmicutes bacterium]|nr:hypothetical protein [Bacillota bacterium]
MTRGKIRHLFPGNNTSIGFFSLYQYMPPPLENLKRYFIIKGGPGVGKSTFMKAIAETILNMGYDIELHHCSSDNASLDGVVIPFLGVAFVDGTAPHSIDPKIPGAVEEIINLGDFWNAAGLQKDRVQIAAAISENGRLFRRAYSHLAVAKIYHDEYESAFSEPGVMDWKAVDRETLEILGDIFSSSSHSGLQSVQRHLFATAITPDGPQSHLDSIVGGIRKRYVISGESGTGKTTILRQVANRAALLGLATEVFHCALEPAKIDHVVIPDLGTAVINGSIPHTYTPEKDDIVISTERFLNRHKLAAFGAEAADAWQRYEDAFAAAITFIARAKQNHDLLENYYIPNMDFKAISDLREQIMRRILSLNQ